MTLRVEPFDEHHDISSFNCGNVELDDWLKLHARTATGHGTRTYVAVDEDDGRVVGYFAIAPHILERDDAPRSVARGAPQHIPAILLAKLALDDSLQGQGLGAELLITALETIIAAARAAGGRVIVVDAIDAAAASFYERHDCERIPDNDRRLVLKLSTAAHALGQSWP